MQGALVALQSYGTTRGTNQTGGRWGLHTVGAEGAPAVGTNGNGCDRVVEAFQNDGGGRLGALFRESYCDLPNRIAKPLLHFFTQPPRACTGEKPFATVTQVTKASRLGAAARLELNVIMAWKSTPF